MTTISTTRTPPRHRRAAAPARRLRRLAFDRSLDDADRSRRIRDAIREHDGEFADHDEE